MNLSLNKIKYVFLHTLFFILFFTIPMFSYAAQGVSSTLSYQGKLTDNGGNALGGGGTSYYFKFSIWDHPTPGQGTKLWPTTNPNSVELTVKQGSFSVNIGDTDNGYPDILDYDFNTNNKVYIQVEVSGDDVSFETLAPRSLISSTAFSQVANSVNGVADSSFGTTTPFLNTLISAISTATNKAVMTIKGAVGQVANLFNILDSNNNSLFTVTADGKVGIGTTTPSSKLSVVGNSNIVQLGAIANSAQTANVVEFKGNVGGTPLNAVTIGNFGNNLFQVYGNTGVSLLNVNNNNAITSIYQLGVGETLPGSKLGVLGGAAIGNTTTFSRATAPTGGLIVEGNLGIGTTAPGAKLQINTGSASVVGQIIKGEISQTSDLQQWQDSSGNVLALIGSNGNIASAGSLSAGNTGFIFNGSSAFGGLTRNGGTASLLLTTQNAVSANFGIQFGNAANTFYVQGASGQTGNLQEWRSDVGQVLNVVTSSGKMGIGTDIPTSMLTIGSGQIETPLGSAAAPSYAFTGDLDTGMYSSTANQIQFGSGGTLRFTIFNGGVESAGQLRGAGYTAATPAIVGGNDTNTGIFYPGSDILGLSTAGTERLRIDAGGNVGIGTSTPSAPLHIYRTGFNSGEEVARIQGGRTKYLEIHDDTIQAKDGASVSNFYFNWLGGNTILNGTGVNGVGIGGTSVGAKLQVNSSQTSSIGQIIKGYSGQTADLLQFQNSSGTVLSAITASGSVGIGTTTPTQKLTVVGNAQFTSVTSGTYGFDLNLTSDGTLTTSASDISLKENIMLISSTSTLEKISQLRPSSFDWKSDGSHDIGLIAQEVELIFPELVFVNPTDGYKGINYSRFITLLISSIQELGNKISGFAKEFRTEKLCIGNTCITEDQLQTLLQNQNTTPPTSSTVNTVIIPEEITASTTETETIPDTDTDTNTDTTPESEVEVITEPTPEPIPEPVIEPVATE